MSVPLVIEIAGIRMIHSAGLDKWGGAGGGSQEGSFGICRF